MADNTVELKQKRIESQVSKIGAEVADANDLNEEIAQLSHKANDKLKAASEELSELYEDLGDEESETQPAQRQPS